ncbi:MAG: hypothetical protein OES09_06255 [Gammaproteobacteria bacterium]|nr:hypothetical protein [Gammaproteobacteria bacterium]
MRTYQHQAEGLEPVSDLRIEHGQVTKSFQFRSGGKTPAGTAYLALALKGLDLSATNASVSLNREPLESAALDRRRCGWQSQILAFPSRRLRDGYNELCISGVRAKSGLDVEQESPRLTVTVRLESDV